MMAEYLSISLHFIEPLRREIAKRALVHSTGSRLSSGMYKVGGLQRMHQGKENSAFRTTFMSVKKKIKHFLIERKINFAVHFCFWV